MQSTREAIAPTCRNNSLSYGFFGLASVAVWAIATVILRLWGSTFFIPESNLSMSASFLFSLCFLTILVLALFRWQQVQPQDRQAAAIALCIPGMLLDAVTTYCFASAFPNLATDNLSVAAAPAFGAWLLWGYAIVLITGFFASRSVQSA